MRLLTFNLHFTGEDMRAEEVKSIAEGHTGSAEVTFRLRALHHCVCTTVSSALWPEEWVSHLYLHEHGEVWEEGDPTDLLDAFEAIHLVLKDQEIWAQAAQETGLGNRPKGAEALHAFTSLQAKSHLGSGMTTALL